MGSRLVMVLPLEEALNLILPRSRLLRRFDANYSPSTSGILNEENRPVGTSGHGDTLTLPINLGWRQALSSLFLLYDPNHEAWTGP